MMKNKKIKETFDEIEKTAQNYEFSREISLLFTQVINSEKKIEDKNIIEKLIWEEKLFSFITRTTLNDTRKERFHPVFSGTNEDGVPFNFPDIKDFNKDAIEYFKTRTSKTQNSVLKSRYSDFIWELTKDSVYGKIASECYLELTDYYYEKTWFVRLHDAFNRLIYFIIIKVVGRDKRKIIKEKLFYFLEKMLTDNQYRFCLELLESFTYFNKEEILKKDISSAIKVCKACIDYFKSSNKHYLERRFLIILEKIQKVNKNIKAVNETKLIRAESLIEEAGEKEKDKNFLISSRLYEEALEILKQLGKKDKISLLKDKLKEVNKKTIKEFKEIKVGATISKKQIKKYTDIILNSGSVEESLKRLAYFNDLVPNYSKLLKQTEKMKEDHPMQFLISQRIFDENGHIVGDDTDPFQNILIRNSMLYIEINSILLDEIFIRLKKEKNFNQESLYLFLKNWRLISNNNLKIIERGINKYFSGDYISSIHILIPRLEEVIRNILRMGGIQTTSLKRGKISITQEKNLGDLLLKKEVLKIFGNSLTWYMRIILTERMGLNLRNEVAHGLIKYEQCSFNNLNKIIHIYILLTRFNLINNK